MNDWHNIYITDKTGKKFFNTSASPMSTMSEIRHLTRHLEAIKAGNAAYAKVGIDQATAKLMLDDEPYQSMEEILDDDDLLAELFD
jgi:uncharacterized protein YqgV (UPF0045/DUF77 family)